ncbi:MAG: hypothetical protein WA154_12200 [Moraxellaceae bacterium]
MMNESAEEMIDALAENEAFEIAERFNACRSKQVQCAPCDAQDGAA